MFTSPFSGGGKYLVCGGQDERIKVYNLLDMKIMGDIGSFAHSGAITCLEFFGDSYLITGSEANIKNSATSIQNLKYCFP